MNSRNAYLKDESLLNLFSLNNLIVPEIQREYVWGNNPDVLEKFLQQLEQIASPCSECHHVHTNKNVNVGFLYSYKPAYVKFEGDRILDEYLIDGQQRITTLFLLLLYRASIEGRVDDFIVISRADEFVSEMGFNYKVRNLTQQFILRLIQHVKESHEQDALSFVDNIDNNAPYWFLNDYKTDPTVMAMISALQIMRKTFGNVNNYYFDFLLNNIHFWHFKTEATSQGEELYITMNSRGEQLTENEMKKSRTLPASEMIKFGHKWEEWQTLFWRKRSGKNADKGFNNYLATIDGLESFISNKGKDENIGIKKIEKYIEALKYVTDTDSKFVNYVKNDSKYTYLEWFDHFQKEIWNIINTYEGSWSIPNPKFAENKQSAQKEYNNMSIARNKAMLFWPWMYYYESLCDEETPNNLYLLRLIHFYYVRYYCYKRSATTITQIVDISKANDFVLTSLVKSEFELEEEEEDDGDSRFFSEEEILISNIENNSSRQDIESLIWEIQDLPYFKDGEDVGGDTFFLYLRDEEIIDRNNIVDSLRNFLNNFTKILADGITETGNIVVKRILLFYKAADGKEFWKRQSPGYYSNYETSVWKRIVRNSCFILFYKEYIKCLKDKEVADIKEFLDYKRKQFYKENNTINRSNNQLCHRELCIIYDSIVENGIWNDQYKNIALNRNEENNEIFKEQDKLLRGNRYAGPKICLPPNWKDLLMKYDVKIEE